MAGKAVPPNTSSGRVRGVELSVAVDAKKAMRRELRITVKGFSEPLVVLAPGAGEVSGALTVKSDTEFDQLLAALGVHTPSVTWWDRDGVVTAIRVSTRWDPSKSFKTATHGAVGMPS